MVEYTPKHEDQWSDLQLIQKCPKLCM